VLEKRRRRNCHGYRPRQASIIYIYWTSHDHRGCDDTKNTRKRDMSKDIYCTKQVSSQAEERRMQQNKTELGGDKWFVVYVILEVTKHKSTREHWIQRITIAAETDAANTHTQRDGRLATQYFLRSLSDGVISDEQDICVITDRSCPILSPPSNTRRTSGDWWAWPAPVVAMLPYAGNL